MIDFEKLLEKHSIDFETPNDRLWIHIKCPFCNDTKMKLGYCIDHASKFAGNFRCWRCGGKKVVDVIKSILHTDVSGAYSAIKQFSIGPNNNFLFQSNIKKGPGSQREFCKLPPGTGPMTERHRNYLRKRNFDPLKIELLWGLRAVGPVGGYNHRIIIPIEFEGKLVSYQGRDITGKSGMKYKACPQELEAREHKHCLYGLDKVVEPSVVVVEGVTDVWRLGPGSVATFGIAYKEAQVALLSRFKRVFILFDEEEQAQEQARKLAGALICPEREVEIVSLSSGDPGEMRQQDANELMEDLLK